MLCVRLFCLRQIPQKNPSSAPTSCPPTALHAFRGFRTSIMALGRGPIAGLGLAPGEGSLHQQPPRSAPGRGGELSSGGDGGTPYSFPNPGGLCLEPVTRQDPSGFGVLRLEKLPPRSYTPITRPRHWPLVAAHSAPWGHGGHRPGHCGWGLRPCSPPASLRSSLRKDERRKTQYKGFISTQQVTQTFV